MTRATVHRVNGSVGARWVRLAARGLWCRL